MIRYIVRDRAGAWMATIYADGSREEPSECTNYYQGDNVVAQVNPKLLVVDSGGRMEKVG